MYIYLLVISPWTSSLPIILPVCFFCFCFLFFCGLYFAKKYTLLTKCVALTGFYECIYAVPVPSCLAWMARFAAFKVTVQVGIHNMLNAIFSQYISQNSCKCNIFPISFLKMRSKEFQKKPEGHSQTKLNAINSLTKRAQFFCLNWSAKSKMGWSGQPVWQLVCLNILVHRVHRQVVQSEYGILDLKHTSMQQLPIIMITGTKPKQALSAYTFFRCTYFQDSVHTTHTCTSGQWVWGKGFWQKWVNNCWWGRQNRTDPGKCTYLYDKTQGTVK